MADIDTIPSRLPDLEPPLIMPQSEPPPRSRLPWLLGLLAVLLVLLLLFQLLTP